MRNELSIFVMDNLEKIRLFPPRLVLLSSEAAIKHVEAGKEIRLAAHNHVDWTFGHFVGALFSKERP